MRSNIINFIKKWYLVIIPLVVFTITFIFCLVMCIDKYNVMKNFNITGFRNNLNSYYIDFEDVKRAKYYKVIITDSSSNEILNETTKESNLTFELNDLAFNENYSINVIAYDKKNRFIEVNEKQEFSLSQPNISVNNSLLLNNEDYTLKIEGDIPDDNYHIIIKEKNKTILDEKLHEDTFVIPKKYYLNRETILNVNLMHNDKFLSNINLYNQTNPIEDIKITSINNKATILKKDVAITYSGGENATEITLYLYEGDKEIHKEVLKSKKYVLSKDWFKEGRKYKVIVKGTYATYEKSASVIFNVVKKITTTKTTKITSTTKKSSINQVENLTNQKAGTADAMIAIAQEQVGNVGGKKFWSWYGYRGRVEWCAIFVSWCARHSGTTTSVIPNFINTGVGARWFKNNNQWHYSKYKGGNYIPKKGDIIFFDWDPNNRIDHVGIVKGVSDGYVITLEGNSGGYPGKAVEKKYLLSSNNLYGFGTPNYNN